MEFPYKHLLAMLNTRKPQTFGIDPHIGRCVTLPRGAAVAGELHQARDEFVLIEDGAFLLYATNGEGARYYLSIIGAGHVFTPQGMSQLLSGTERFGVEVMRDVKLKVLTRDQWDSLSREQADLYNWVIEQESQLLQIVQFHLAQYAQRSSLDKTRFALCTYAKGLGKPNPCGSRTIKVTRAELASWIGVSSDRICRLIRELHHTGEVELIGRSIKVNSGLLRSLYPANS